MVHLAIRPALLCSIAGWVTVVEHTLVSDHRYHKATILKGSHLAAEGLEDDLSALSAVCH